ncbi:terpene cyclase [Cercophora samala]|uniref:Terpene synthase n=1 Tax=Cercophora samala TaxID=330535 RepID=A0AA40D305_9PEZI|nr:terpene cyclase [Cercophora samala]
MEPEVNNGNATASSGTTFIRLHNTLSKFPWPKSINPHYEECAKASHDWVATFDMFSPKTLAVMWNSLNGYLSSLAWPNLPKNGLQIGCDAMNVFWILEVTTDRCTSAAEAQTPVDCFMDALRDPTKPRPEEEWRGASVAQSLMERMISSGASNGCIKRFIKTMQQFCDSLVQEADDRSRGHIRDVEAYFEVRRHTIGLYPCFAIIQHGMELPDEVYEHDVVRKLEIMAADMIILDNDLVSYNVEQARGEEGHNLVRVAMHQFGFGLQESIDWVGKHHAGVLDAFLMLYGTIPVAFPGETDLHQYAWGVGNWVRANWQWSWEVSSPGLSG